MGCTTFIVGAGASAEFEFPLGSKLAESIRQDLRVEFIATDKSRVRNGPLYTATTEIDSSNERWRQAAEHLFAGLLSTSTIDQFLHAHRHDADVQVLGKIAIANRILGSERGCPFKAIRESSIERAAEVADRLRRTWIGQLYLRLCGGRSPFELANAFNDIAIVTFNYDRCIEYFLYWLLIIVGRISSSDAAEIVRSISIYHAYGSLGDISELRAGGVMFGADTAQCHILARDIFTFREEAAKNGAVGGRVRERISSSEKLVFLGFGYDQENLAFLAPNEFSPKQKLFGTVRGIDELRQPPHIKALRKRGLFINADASSFVSVVDEIFSAAA